MKGVNDDEVFDFIDFASQMNVIVRFIELMPMNGSNYSDQIEDPPNSTSKTYEVYYKGKFLCKIGFITTISEPFCFSCNRLRLTAKGSFKPCLFSNLEFNIKNYLYLLDGEILQKILDILKLKKLIRVQETKNYMVEIGG